MKILVVANETVDSDRLHDVVRAAAGAPRAQVLVVAPALNTRLRHWLSDNDAAREAAQTRLIRCVGRLAALGVDVNGMIGDSDPLQATLDALRVFPANEVVVATHPEYRSNWLARHLVERMAAHFAGPIVHLVVAEEPSRRPQLAAA
jgi:hypothetical protein